jgi:hypothetical protein
VNKKQGLAFIVLNPIDAQYTALMLLLRDIAGVAGAGLLLAVSLGFHRFDMYR